MQGKVQTAKWVAGAHICCCYPADRMWGWRSWFHFDCFIILVAPFLWIICSRASGFQMKSCLLSKLCFCARVIFTAVAQWKCRTVCEREGTQGWGGGFGGATQRWLALRNTQSLRRGRHCRLEKGLCSTEVCGHHWLWESIKLLHRKKRGRDAVSSNSSSGPNHIVAMCVCVCVFLHAKPQKAAWRAMWCHPLSSAVHGRAGASSCGERVGWAQILEAGTGWEQGLALGRGWCCVGHTTHCSRDIKGSSPSLKQTWKYCEVLPDLKRSVQRGFKHSNCTPMDMHICPTFSFHHHNETTAYPTKINIYGLLCSFKVCNGL